MIKKIFLLSLSILSLLLISCSTGGSAIRSDGTAVYITDAKKIAEKNIIEGHVADSVTGSGIKDARVEIKNVNKGIGYYLRETDSSGYFKIDDFIPYVKYSVEIAADGYVTYRSSGSINPGSHKLQMHREAILAGSVKDLGGSPISGVEIRLKPNTYGEYGRPLTATTGRDGTYEFRKLQSGSYSVYFSKPGYITESAYLQRIKNSETFRLPMVLSKPASISGRLKVSGLDAPAINVSITAKGKMSYYATSYRDGTYVLESLKPGNYRLAISHEGFNTQSSGIITVTEGKDIEGMNFQVNPKSPNIEINSYRYTFTPGDSIEFNLRTFRLESATVTIYKVPVNIFLTGGINPDGVNPSEEGFERAASWEEPIQEFRPYEWKYQTLQIKHPLPTGGYCIEVKGADSVISRKYFTVTSTGVVIKRSQDSIFAYATNLIDNKPISGAQIALYDITPNKQKNKYTDYNLPSRIEDLPVDILLKGKTNELGIFHKKFKSQARVSALAVSPDGSYAICNTGSPLSFAREKTKYFIYTDRPVYRAGDTVHYKIIGKSRKERFVPADDKYIYYKIINRDMSKTISEGEASLDEWGTANSKIAIAPDAILGEYEILAGPDAQNLYSSGTFYVEQYRKPEFNIEITPSKDYYINGDTAEFKIEAKYFFGAPLKNALIKYRFYETILNDRDAYWWEEDGGESRPYNKIKLEGDKYCDENGIANLQIAAGNFTYDREITVEATITDSSNVSITETKTVKIGRGDFYLKISPLRNFYSTNEKKEIEISAVTHTGKLVSTAVSLNLYRYIWRPAERVYVHESKPVYTKKINTGDKGKAVIELPKNFDLSGEFDLTAEATDRRDNRITASRIIWIYNTEGTVAASKFKNLELSLSSTELANPSEVTCLVKSRFMDSYVCLTLEGRDIYESKLVKMDSNIVPVKFNIKSSYAPNLYLTATMQRKKALYTSSTGISLPVKDTGLKMSLKPDRDRYKPGEKASITIRVTDTNGEPVRADLSLGAVDEAIYYIRRDHTPKMSDYFYTRISNWVLTSYSYPLTILAGAGKEGKTKVREKFQDTAFWKADIKTNESGMAKIEFQLPDNLTTWRLTARGHDLNGRVGETIQKFLVTQDLIARIGKPRFFTEGDLVSLIGIINSNTDRGLPELKSEFKVNGKTIRPDSDTALSLPSYGSARKFYSVTVPEKSEKSVLDFSATADSEAADAVRYTVPIQRKGVSYKLYGTGDMSLNRKVDISPLKESDDFDFVPESITISVNPSPVIQMLQAIKFLDEYPYGCIEQTINKFIPNLAMMKIMKTGDIGRFIDDKAKSSLPDKVRAGIDRIQGYQNEDGTWGWWSGDRGNAFLTGYVLFSLYTAWNAGYSIDVNSANSGLEAVNRMLSNPDVDSNDAVAYLSFIYSLWSRWNDTGMAKLLKLKNRNPYQLAFMIRAISHGIKNRKFSGEKTAAMNKALAELTVELKSLQKKDDKGIYWQSVQSQAWDWPGGDSEITAHVLAALTDSGDTSSIPSQIAKSLSNRARDGHWSSTKETSSAIFAISGYLDRNPSVLNLKGNLAFTLNGNRVASIDYNLEKNKNIIDLKQTASLSGMDKQKGFAIEASGESGPDTSFDAVISGTLYFKSKGFLSLFKSEVRSLKSLSNGISILRTFSGINRVRDMNRTEYLVPQSLADKKEISVGDEILVKIKFTAEDDFKFLVLEDYLPSGFEVTNKNAYDEYTPFVHSERWDNRMVFFFTNLRKGEVYEVAYLVRAELPGKFMIKPSRMECMYEPSIQGWSAPAVIEVKKKD